MKPRANFWIEQDGEVVLSSWRVDLLQAIAETGSITAGAEKMNVPYRVAWQKIREIEERLGTPVLETHTGGPGGGGARLTPAGERYVQQFREFTRGLNELVQQRYREVFHEN
ncbi:MAG: LysR family transcriptional regulator [Chloroflexi bacterium]|nr:MAG: LysR family transcriptional regulator [Chloroflexota bacterium]